jgi:hypothetical protein
VDVKLCLKKVHELVLNKVNLRKFFSVGVTQIHADRPTDTTQLIGAFRKCANAPNV